MAELRATGLTDDRAGLVLREESGQEHVLAVDDRLLELVDEATAPEQPAEPAADQDPEQDAPQPSPENEGETENESEAENQAAADDVVVARENGVSREDGVTREASVRSMSVAQEPAAAPSAPREPLSPKEIQARIRAGATAEEVAESTGTSLARVRTFEYPVVAERAWVAQTARATEIWVGGPDLYSDIVDDGGPSTLEEIVGHRLQQLGGDADAISWDAWKEAHGGWTVTAVFDAGLLHTLPTRDTPPARWSYRPGARSVDHANRWARLLSDAQDWEVRPAAQEEADAAVFDVEEEDTGAAEDAPVETSPAHVDAAQADEAEGEVAEPTALPRRAAREDQRRENDGDDQEQQDQLLDILRARRGQRLGADEDSDDTLALLLTREHEPASGTEDRRAADAESASTEYLWDDDADSSDAAVYRFPTATEPSPQSAQPADSANEDANSNADDADKAAPTSPRPAKSRAKSTGKRSSVPSWDEIIFGRKND